MDAPQKPGFSMQNGDVEAVRASLRTQIGAATEWAYLDHAAVGPIPLSASIAIKKWADQAAWNGDFHWPEWSSIAGRLRNHAAELLSCQSDEIALIPNTTFGINIVASGFRWDRFRNPSMVVLENEFSSNLLPWLELRRRGVDVRIVPVDESGIVSYDAIARSIDDSTRLVSVSWVGYLSGYRLDLEKLCSIVHGTNARLFVDAIQGLGVFPCDVSQFPIDFLAADGHKWLLGPEGSGLLYMRRDRWDEVESSMIGWGSIESAHHFQTKDVAIKKNVSRFEGGSANHAGQIGLERSLRLLLDHGCNMHSSPTAHSVMENANCLAESLRKIGCTVWRDLEKASLCSVHGSGIVGFEVPGHDPSKIRSELIQHKVMLSVRHGRLRAALHAYNNRDDIERLIDVLKHELHQHPQR